MQRKIGKYSQRQLRESSPPRKYIDTKHRDPGVLLCTKSIERVDTACYKCVMARNADHAKAIELRKQGKSYSEIKEALSVGKSTLSAWLRDYPLTPEQLKNVRDYNPLRIEKCRQTKQRKRQKRLDAVYARVARDLSSETKRELLVAGFYLYWAEGAKTKPYTVMLANTDYTMLCCFLEWIEFLGWSRQDVKVRVQLYADMDVEKEMRYWKSKLHLPSACYRKPYIKKTNRADISYKGGYSHGTCNIIIDNRDLSEYVRMGIAYLQERHSARKS